VLACPSCKHEERIPTSNESIQELSYVKYLTLRPEQLTQIADVVQQVECKSCGAMVVFTPPEVARSCPFCAAAIVMQPKSADPMLCPEAVLPFAVEKKDAEAAVNKWIAGRWFAPDALKRFAITRSIAGVYIPFWTYDTYTTSSYAGSRGEHYYVTEEYTETDQDGNRVTKTRQVQKTNWYPAAGIVSHWFDDILIPATTSMQKNYLMALEPWDLPALKPYDPAFLSGFQAQRYQVGMAEGFEEAKQIAAPEIESLIRLDIGGDEQRIDYVQTQYSAITFKHILMPVYVGAYTLKEKVYQVLVNGRTGEVQGERPYSVIKITFAIISAMIALYFFIVYLRHLSGNAHP
jgi:hypothetical protein